MRVLGRIAALAICVLLAAQAAPAVMADTPAATNTEHGFVVVTFANQPLRPVARAGSNGPRYTGGSYGVAAAAHTDAERIARTYSLKQVDSWPIKALGVHCVVYEITDSRSVSDVVAQLTRDSRITLAQPLQQFHTLTAPPPPDSPAAPGTTGAAAGHDSGNAYNDPLYGLQTNLVSLGIPAAHEQSQGAGIRVALIDTGVDTAHPDLQGQIVSTRSFIPGNQLTNIGGAWYRHGTAMAGLIAAVANNGVGIVGIAPMARLEVYAACWQLRQNADEAACNTFTLAQALAAALETRAPIINLSIAGPADPLLSALVRKGLAQGVIFVGSTTAEADTFPTNIPGVIGAGDSDAAASGAAGALRFAAPASHVLTLRPAAQYDFESGTSVAAAEMSGIVALLLGADRSLGADAMVAVLKGAPVSGPAQTMVDVTAALAKVTRDQGRGHLAQTEH